MNGIDVDGDSRPSGRGRGEHSKFLSHEWN